MGVINLKRKTKNLYFSIITVFVAVFMGHAHLKQIMPDNFYITEGSEAVFNENTYFSIHPSKSWIQTGANTNSENLCYDASLNLFGFIPIKPVNVSVVKKMNVIPCGKPFGVKIFTEGAMVINISDVRTKDGVRCPGKESNLQKGDIITKVNETQVFDNESFAKTVEESKGEPLKVSVIREKIAFDTVLKPVVAEEDGALRAGVWVRDSSSGIGTMTFFNPETHNFSGLGHGICDVTTGSILSPSHGNVITAEIVNIVKGTKGTPGMLKGKFTNSVPIGDLFANIETGIYGKLFNPPCDLEPIEVAMKQQVKTGPAKILTTLEGSEPEIFEINIDSINYNVTQPTKNILISITDKKLIEKTGGIVQGMSGSPIIQRGMLVGAITHVFVNEPTKGYAIFAETMLKNIKFDK